MNSAFAPSRVWLLLSTALALGACKEDRCKGEAPAFEIEVSLGAGVASAGIERVLVDVSLGARTQTASFDPAPLVARGRAPFTVLVGDTGRGGFSASVIVRAVDKTGTTLARGADTYSGHGDACNFFAMTLASATDGGVDTLPDVKPDANPCPPGQILCGQCNSASDPQNCGKCGNVCPSSEKCVDALCEVALAGPVSGLKDHAGKRVVMRGTVTLIAYNGTDDLQQCDVNDTGCLKVVAAQIVVDSTALVEATGAGAGGGGGGGGGAGYVGDPFGSPKCSDSQGGAAGKGARHGADGQAGSLSKSGSVSGAGGKGGGPRGGGGGAAILTGQNDAAKPGAAGAAGGYNGAGQNGDQTQGEELWIGSGGGGGSGGASAAEAWVNSVGGSGGGGAGNAGGGMIVLVASQSIDVAGKVVADGRTRGSGDGGKGTDGQYKSVQCDLSGSGGPGGNAGVDGTSAGADGVAGYINTQVYEACFGGPGIDGGGRNCNLNGSTSIKGGRGGDGAAGSGGGILLKAPTVTVTGTISTLGGGGVKANGGTLKIFHRMSSPPQASQFASTVGRPYISNY